jgi:hypothetical protein
LCKDRQREGSGDDGRNQSAQIEMTHEALLKKANWVDDV